MSKKHIQILNGSDSTVITAMKRINSDVLKEFLRLEIEELEYKLRYSKEETERYQGALRALDDISDLLLST